MVNGNTRGELRHQGLTRCRYDDAQMSPDPGLAGRPSRPAGLGRPDRLAAPCAGPIDGRPTTGG